MKLAETVFHINDTHYNKYQTFISDVIFLIKECKYISYKDLEECISSNLGLVSKAGRVTKDLLIEYFSEKKINKILWTWKKKNINIGLEHFEFFMRCETRGIDFRNYEYFINKYELERDNNGTIIFTEDFPFDLRIKKEALIIDTILYRIKIHPVLGLFLDKIKYMLQYKFRRSQVIKAGTKLYDIAFPELGIIVENDENHDSSVADNDDLKTSYVKINGMILMRLNLKEIIGTSEKNFGSRIYNSGLFGKFLDDLMSMIQAALFATNIEVVNRYILDKCKENITTLRDSVQENNEIFSQELLNNNNSIIKETHKINSQLLYVLNEMLENEDSVPNVGFEKYFKIKNDYIKENKLVKASFLVKMKVFLKDKIFDAKRILALYKIIKVDIEEHFDFNSIDLDEVYLTWDQIRFIVSIIKHNNENIKNMTLYYLNTVEELFGFIHGEINKYNTAIRACPEDAERVIGFIEKITSDSLITNIKEKDKDISDLKFEVIALNNRVKDKDETINDLNEKIAKLQKQLCKAKI